MSRSICWLMFCFANFAFIPSGRAFQILSAITSPCHENMTLGVFGMGDAGFVGDGNPSVASLLNRFIARANTFPLPDDQASRAIVKEMSDRFGWQNFDDTKRYVLTSFVAGARSPDTQGFSIIDINNIRGNHLTDSAQPAHLLRTRTNDGITGNAEAIAATRSRLTGLLQGVLSAWIGTDSLARGERWSFPFYGDQTVQVFGPAFDLGAMSHTMQDSYAHTIRDENFKIIAVANYLEQMLEQRDEVNDGPGHSDRLDHCDMNDPFDVLRVNEARKSVGRMMNGVDTLLAGNSQDGSSVESILDDVFTYRPGCDINNNYCDAPWSAKAHEDLSEPYKLGFNCNTVHGLSSGGSGGGLGPLSRSSVLMPFLLMLLPIVSLVGLRRKVRRASHSPSPQW